MAVDVSKVRYISLIRMEGGESVLNIPYAEMTVDPDLIAGFVTAVIIFARTPIRTIRKAAYDILIEVGETVLVLLVVDPVPDEAPYRERLKRILDKVEEEHGKKLKNFEGDVRVFREFSLNVVKEFPFMELDLGLVPYKKLNGEKIRYRVGDVDQKLERVEAFINGKRTLGEIMDLIGLDEDEVQAAVSILYKHKWIDFKRRLIDKDVLKVKDCPESVLRGLRGDYGSALDDLLKAFDGTRSIEDVLSMLAMDANALRYLVNRLVEVGCLTHI